MCEEIGTLLTPLHRIDPREMISFRSDHQATTTQTRRNRVQVANNDTHATRTHPTYICNAVQSITSAQCKTDSAGRRHSGRSLQQRSARARIVQLSSAGAVRVHIPPAEASPPSTRQQQRQLSDSVPKKIFTMQSRCHWLPRRRAGPKPVDRTSSRATHSVSSAGHSTG